MPSLKGLKHAPSYMSGGPPDLPLRLFHPLGKTRVIWDLCGLLLLIVDTILLPLSLAFGWTSGTQDAGSFILLLDFIASVFFWTLDIFMNVNTAFYSKGALVYDRHAIVRRYVKTWLLGLTAALAGSPYSPLVSAAVHTLDLSAFTPPPMNCRTVRVALFWDAQSTAPAVKLFE